MITIIWIIVAFSVVAGVVAFLFSDKGGPRERASEAVGAAAGGAMVGVSCLFQLIVPAIMLLAGLWLLKTIWKLMDGVSPRAFTFQEFM
jgi:hypothetical protein